MSTKTDISDIRKGIANNKLKPVVALNQVTASFSHLIQKLPEDHIGCLISDIWNIYFEMATGSTVHYDSYGHNKQWFDSKIAEMGRLMIELEKKVKKEIKKKS